MTPDFNPLKYSKFRHTALLNTCFFRSANLLHRRSLSSIAVNDDNNKNVELSIVENVS